MNLQDVIVKPILTEKAHQQMVKGVYMFQVADKSTKNDVKRAVNLSFSVDVVNVNIISMKAKQKKVAKTRKFTMVGGGKKAIVSIKPGQTIAALSPKTEAKEKKVKNKSSEKEIEKVKIEGKEGA
ncbi:50S ribosomal protein L23 [Candidatus Curtissbacteria bacterium]|nr:50S ribosomal protein L23 [Candidatus Curtissbacteria bacterium]